LLVILIFLMVTTTYSRFAELQINLPTAEAGKPPERPAQLDVAVDAKGNTTINRNAAPAGNAAALSEALKRAAGDMKDPVIVINADANASHQSVVRVMEAAQIAGYPKITFTTQARK
jgi:biopolymer transport protein ExbD